jgi:hypothetical protein
VTVDDVWFDPAHLVSTLEGLDKAIALPGGPTQAIVCAVEFSGKVPNGWKVVRVGEAA